MFNLVRCFGVLIAGAQQGRQNDCHSCSKKLKPSCLEHVVCAHCQSAICMQCFRRQVEGLEMDWYARLRCLRCDWMYWPTLFLNGIEEQTELVVGDILRSLWANRLLDAMTSCDEGGKECLVCYERGIGSFRACLACSFSLCKQCFLLNIGRGTQYGRCPGCRDFLEAFKLLEELEEEVHIARPCAVDFAITFGQSQSTALDGL